MQRFVRFLHHQSVILLVSFISLCVGVAIAGSLAFGHHLIESQALQSSQTYIQAIRTAWTVYHDDVLQRLSSIDEVTVSPRYKTIEGSVPTPIAYLTQLSKQLQAIPGHPQFFIRTNTSSSPAKQDALVDPFQKNVQDYFLTHDDAFYQVGMAEGYQAFNYAEPIIMESSCIACHQTLENPAVSDWQTGEIIGFLAVRQPLTNMIQIVNENVQIIGLISGLLGSVGVAGGILTRRHWKASEQLLRDELEQKTIALERLDLTDALTQVANQRQFSKALNQEWRRVWRQNGHLSLLICNIDYFKQYNDIYGLQAGDHCLKQVAQAIQTELKRAGDLVARHQGDEFYVLLPETNAAESEEVAAILLDAIHRLKIVHAQSDVSPYISISIGIASTNPNKGRHPDELIAHAEKALYTLKQSSRNDFEVLSF